jgi:predicted LPLAT superfamily acyltransferase
MVTRAAEVVSEPRLRAEWAASPERGSLTLLRWMTFVSLRLGRPVGRVILLFIAAYFFAFAPSARVHSLAYLRIVLGRRPRWRDRFRQVQVASGEGAVVMGAHMGSFEILSAIGRQQRGVRVAMAMYHENARKVSAMLKALNPVNQAEIIALGNMDSMLRIRECIEGGGFVGFLGDRRLRDSEPGVAVPFLGGHAVFPSGPMRAAALLRARVFFVLGLYQGANRYHVVFAPLADFSGIGPRERKVAVEAAIRRYAGLLELHCRRDPCNWFNFFDFWQKRR